MSQARMDLLRRLSKLAASASMDEVNSKEPQEEKWNERARLLRMAIILSVFTSLEDFIKRRVVEALSELRKLSPKSKAFPSALLDALTVGAFQTSAGRIASAARFKIADVRQFALAQARKIGSLSDSLVIPSEMALADNRSNVSWELIERALLSFGVESPGSVLGGVARRIAGGVFAPKDHFESAIVLRHQVAHEPWFDMPVGDVSTQLQTAAMLCCSFDAVLSTAAARIVHGAHLMGPVTTGNKQVSLIYVQRSGGKWRYKKEGAKRGKIAADEERAFQEACRAGSLTQSCVVVTPRGVSDPYTRWDTPFL